VKTAYGIYDSYMSETAEYGVKAGNKKSGRSREHELEREYPACCWPGQSPRVFFSVMQWFGDSVKVSRRMIGKAACWWLYTALFCSGIVL
jgi:hypothetical protein